MKSIQEYQSRAYVYEINLLPLDLVLWHEHLQNPFCSVSQSLLMLFIMSTVRRKMSAWLIIYLTRWQNILHMRFFFLLLYKLISVGGNYD